MMKTSDLSSPQPYYYTDSEFQLELNIQAIRRELIIFLDLETRDCDVCLRMKCHCKKKTIKTAESNKSDNTVSTLTEISAETKDKGENCKTKELTKAKSADENDQIKINTVTLDTSIEVEVFNEKETPKKDNITSIASPLKSPPASSLPKPTWDSPSSSSNRNKETNLKTTAAWVASLAPPKKMEKEKDVTTWSVTSVWCEKEVNQIRDGNTPVEDFFKSFNKNFQGKWSGKGNPQASQVNKMIPALKHKMTLAPQNNYNYF